MTQPADDVAREQGESPAAPIPGARPEAVDFDALVPRFEAPLLRYVGQLLGPTDHEVEDVVQDTFLRLHRHVGKHGDRSVRNLSTWLFRVAHNLTMDTLRKRKVRRQGRKRIVQDAVTDGSVDGLAPAGNDDSVDALGDLERREACQRAMAEVHNLPEHQKQAVLLKMIQGMTIRQIARVTDTSIGNVGYRINQGLAELSRRLKEAGVI